MEEANKISYDEICSNHLLSQVSTNNDSHNLKELKPKYENENENILFCKKRKMKCMKCILSEDEHEDDSFSDFDDVFRNEKIPQFPNSHKHINLKTENLLSNMNSKMNNLNLSESQIRSNHLQAILSQKEQDLSMRSIGLPEQFTFDDDHAKESKSEKNITLLFESFRHCSPKLKNIERSSEIQEAINCLKQNCKDVNVDLNFNFSFRHMPESENKSENICKQQEQILFLKNVFKRMSESDVMNKKEIIKIVNEIFNHK